MLENTRGSKITIRPILRIIKHRSSTDKVEKPEHAVIVVFLVSVRGAVLEAEFILLSPLTVSVPLLKFIFILRQVVQLLFSQPLLKMLWLGAHYLNWQFGVSPWPHFSNCHDSDIICMNFVASTQFVWVEILPEQAL